MQEFPFKMSISWVNRCVKTSYAFSVKALWVTLGENEIFQHAVRILWIQWLSVPNRSSLLVAGCRYWVIRLKQTVTLTFSDLCVESSSVGVEGGRGAVKVKDHMEVCMKSHWRLHTTNQPSPLAVSENTEFSSLHERSVFNKGAGNTLLLW